MQTRLTHARANVRDLSKAIAWYTEVLGFEVDAVWPPENPNYAHFAAAEGAIFAIMVSEQIPSTARFNFSVSNVDQMWERLKDKVKVIEPLHDTPYGTRKFTIADPDGNELGFVEE